MFRPTQQVRQILFYIIFVSALFYGNGVVYGQTDNVAQIDRSKGPQPWTHINWNNDPEKFQFVIVADRAGAHREGVFAQGIEKVNLLQPEFVMCIGDLIEGYTEDIKQIRKEWAEFDKITAQLNMPFFFVPGNHDIGGKELVEIWKEKFGRTYYHFVYRDVLFLCLNSEGDESNKEAPRFSKEQVKYAVKTLRSNPDVRWTLVFMHSPIWRGGKEMLKHSGWNDIESALKDRKHTVFAGHTHRYAYQTRNKQDYITLATTGGGSSFTNPFMQFDHVLWVTVTDDGPILANLMLEGIWDKDFTREDVQKHLSLVTSGKAVRIETKYDDKTLSTSQPVTIRLSNSQDIPMEITLSFEKNEYVHFTPENIVKTIPPNSVEKLTVKLHIDKLERSESIEEEMEDQEEGEEEEGALAKIWDELWYLHLRWSINYDYDKYGKINLTGARELF
jgi:UDP-2,3-diacylglucosamine pyrophosphatase LpxH